ncbi:Myb/SANT-like DNA-binding domain-containing protein [Infundibulicybe gibba]|nr:Myb/SANT-like DNA-binding domain-containing protein [Infundibulicybe gibba]
MPPKKKAVDSSDPVSRAVWTSTCDAILLECLQKQKENGRMTDNSSWHRQAWTEAEKALSGTELKTGGAKKVAKSCQDRWTALKKDYVMVKKLRDNSGPGISGFGWNDTLCIVTASDEVWDAVLKSNPNLKKWRKKPFPLYDDMHDLVVGTVATGDGVFRPGRRDDATPPIIDVAMRAMVTILMKIR